MGKSLMRIAVATATTAGAVALFTGVGSAAPAQHGDPALFLNPVLTGPSTTTLPSSCPPFLSTDSWVLDFTPGGNGVGYGTANQNGDWGGVNAEGPGVITDGAVTKYMGHLHVWFGQGQNSTSGENQTEQGFTMSFAGANPDTGAGISIVANAHISTDNAGNQTAAFEHGSVTCS